MRKDDIEKAMVDTIVGIFSEMVFIDTYQIKEEPDNFEFTQILYIDIVSPVSGYIIAYLPLELRKKIVETIHATDWDEMHANEIDDCLLETLNVIAGNFMTELMGRSVRYNISFPSVNFDEEDLEDLELSQRIYFDAEGSVFRINILIREEGV